MIVEIITYFFAIYLNMIILQNELSYYKNANLNYSTYSE